MRKIIIDLYDDEPLPDDIHGVSVLRPSGEYMVFTSSQDAPERRLEAFLHEMVHIYQNDHQKADLAAVEFSAHNKISTSI